VIALCSHNSRTRVRGSQMKIAGHSEEVVGRNQWICTHEKRSNNEIFNKWRDGFCDYFLLKYFTTLILSNNYTPCPYFQNPSLERIRSQ